MSPARLQHGMLPHRRFNARLHPGEAPPPPSQPPPVLAGEQLPPPSREVDALVKAVAEYVDQQDALIDQENALIREAAEGIGTIRFPEYLLGSERPTRTNPGQLGFERAVDLVTREGMLLLEEMMRVAPKGTFVDKARAFLMIATMNAPGKFLICQRELSPLDLWEQLRIRFGALHKEGKSKVNLPLRQREIMYGHFFLRKMPPELDYVTWKFLGPFALEALGIEDSLEALGIEDRKMRFPRSMDEYIIQLFWRYKDSRASVWYGDYAVSNVWPVDPKDTPVNHVELGRLTELARQVEGDDDGDDDDDDDDFAYDPQGDEDQEEDAPPARDQQEDAPPARDQQEVSEIELGRRDDFMLKRLKELGWHVLVVPGDGNCAFHAIIEGIKHHKLPLPDEMDYKALRAAACDELESKKPKDYIAKMRKNKEYAFDDELKAAVCFLNRTCLMNNRVGLDVFMYREGNVAENEDRDCHFEYSIVPLDAIKITLYHRNGNHFDPMVRRPNTENNRPQTENENKGPQTEIEKPKRDLIGGRNRVEELEDPTCEEQESDVTKLTTENAGTQTENENKGTQTEKETENENKGTQTENENKGTQDEYEKLQTENQELKRKQFTADFWIGQQGRAAAQISQLEKEVSRKNEEIERTAEQISQLKEEVSGKDEEIADLRGRMEKKEEDFRRCLAEQISQLEEEYCGKDEEIRDLKEHIRSLNEKRKSTDNLEQVISKKVREEIRSLEARNDAPAALVSSRGEGQSTTHNHITLQLHHPGAVPTNQPVAVPTNQPVAVPTNQPVAVPTNQPVAVPTNHPGAVPTNPQREEHAASSEFNSPQSTPSSTVAMSTPGRLGISSPPPRRPWTGIVGGIHHLNHIAYNAVDDVLDASPTPSLSSNQNSNGAVGAGSGDPPGSSPPTCPSNLSPGSSDARPRAPARGRDPSP